MCATGKLSESETCLILNTFMYLNYYDAVEGQKLIEIIYDLSWLEDYQPGGIHYGEFEIIKEAVADNPGLGELEISSQSGDLGFDSGTGACLFKEPTTETVYVVYRGTGDGEWLDNGLGLTLEATTQQERAVDYFERAMDRGQFTEDNRIIITGHSKGGNKAQFVTMTSSGDYERLIDKCISVDGQGFSTEAVKKWQKEYDLGEYQARINKLHGINGENDFVSALGNSLIPPDQLRFLHTPVEKGNITGYHNIKYFFASKDYRGRISFSGKSNQVVVGQKEWGAFAGELSDRIMALTPEERAGCAAAVMQLVELGGERKSGINGEKVVWTDWQHFIATGIPTVISTLLYSGEGKRLIESLFITGGDQGCFYAVKADLLSAQAAELLKSAAAINRIASETETTAGKLSTSLRFGFAKSMPVSAMVRREGVNLKEEAIRLGRLAGLLERVVKIYAATEQTIANI